MKRVLHLASGRRGGVARCCARASVAPSGSGLSAAGRPMTRRAHSCGRSRLGLSETGLVEGKNVAI